MTDSDREHRGLFEEAGVFWDILRIFWTVVRSARSATHQPNGDIVLELSAPTRIVFILSLVLAAIGILSLFGVLPPMITAYGFWSLVTGYVVLAVAVLFKGL